MNGLLPNKYKWHKKKEMQTGTILERILQGRGIKEEADIQNFLNPTREQMHSPYLLNDMDKAVERINRAKKNKEHIVIYGDYDVDGVTSTSILYMFLKEENYDVSYYIPNRTEEGYGLNKGALEKIRKYSTLVITVDTGIAANEEVAFGNTIGLDIIITDHHECQEELPKAYCTINPKRHDTTYPFDCLAGVGVTFKLIHALAIKADVEDKIWKYIDIVALGTVADVVPLEKENRIITSIGFKQMAVSEHIGLRALLDVVQNVKGKITSNLIGYQLGPRINAAGRISDAKIGVRLLTTKDEKEAGEIARLLDEENKKRQDMEQEILLEAEKYIESYIDTDKEKIIIVAGDGWHHGVIGIVASRIMGKYYKPTIVLTKEDGIYSGSARSVDGFNIFEAINAVKERLLRFGGHEMAAGLSMEEQQLEAFRRDINTYAKDLLTEDLLTPSLVVDLEVEAHEISLEVCEILEQLEPFGVSNPTPLFSVKGCVQYAQKIGQDKHLKLSLQKEHQVLHGVGFEKGYLADFLTEGEEIVLACELTKNVWNDKVSLQLRIKDVMSPNDKVMKSKYYLQLYNYLKEVPDLEDRPLVLTQTHAENVEPFSVYTENSFKKCMTNSEQVWYNGFCVFNEVTHYEWDFKTTGNFTCVKTSLTDHKEQMQKMIPSYVDCKDVYKYLKMNQETVPLHKIVEQFEINHMTEYKVLQILDVFSELELLSYKLIEGEIHYLLKQSKKTNLEHSSKYMSLQKYAQSIINKH